MSDIATVKVELSDEQMEVLLADIRETLDEIDGLKQRIGKLERKLNHKGGKE